jgi:hypothetical protein
VAARTTAYEQVVQALGERGVARELVAAGDLVEEGAGLVDEAVVVAGPDSGGVHGQAAGDVGVLDADDDPSEAVRLARQPAADDRELTGTADVEGEGTLLAEDLELQGVRVAVGNAGDAEVAGRPVGEAHREARPVVVHDRLALVADLDVGMPDNVSQRQRSLRDDVGQRGAGHRLDRAEQELRRVGQVAAEVGQRPGTGAAAVAPAHRGLRVGAVVCPVLRADVERAPEPT